MTRLRVGIAGLGTVGRGVAKLFADGGSRLNEKMQLVAVSALETSARGDGGFGSTGLI